MRLNSRYQLSRAFDLVLNMIRSVAHTVLPRNSAPQFYRQALIAIFRILAYDNRSQTVTVQRGLLKGLKKYGPFIMGDYEFAMGTFEQEVAQALSQLCKVGMVVADIGASAGYHTLLMAHQVGPSGLVYAFEPAPENATYLYETVRLNGYKHVRVEEVAIANQDGWATFNFFGALNGYSGLTDTGYGVSVGASKHQVITVPTITLDSFCAQRRVERIHVIKIDIEGAELAALAGMREVITRWHPTLIIEFWGKRALTDGPALLTELGYSVSTLSTWRGLVERQFVEVHNLLAVYPQDS